MLAVLLLVGQAVHTTLAWFALYVPTGHAPHEVGSMPPLPTSHTHWASAVAPKPSVTLLLGQAAHAALLSAVL